MKKIVVLVAFLFSSSLFARTDYQHTYHNNSSDTAPLKGFLGGGVLGAALGGAIKGGKGAGWGALAGAGIGTISGLIARRNKNK